MLERAAKKSKKVQGESPKKNSGARNFPIESAARKNTSGREGGSRYVRGVLEAKRLTGEKEDPRDSIKDEGNS